MADKVETGAYTIIAISRQEACNLIGLLAAQLADKALGGGTGFLSPVAGHGAAMTLNVTNHGKPFYITIKPE